MSCGYICTLTDRGCKGNYIPSGRQLSRTPPVADVTRYLDFCDEDVKDDLAHPQQNHDDAGTGERAQQCDPNTMCGLRTPEGNTGSSAHVSQQHDPNSVLRGMKGYQMTPGDLEFIKQMKQENCIKKLQEDLAEVQKLLKSEMMALDLALASKEKAQTELNKFPSCEELRELAKVVLKKTILLPTLEELDIKSLLAMVKKEDVQRAIDEKTVVLAQMEAVVTNKRKQQAKERGQQEKTIHSKQLKIKGMMNELSNLASELAKVEEAHKALEMQMNQEMSETRVQVEEINNSNEVQAANGKVKPRGKERKRAPKSADVLQDKTKQSKPTKKTSRVKDADKLTIQKGDASQTLKTSTKASEGCAQKSSNQSKPTKTLRVRDGDKRTRLKAPDTTQNLKTTTKGLTNRAEDDAQNHSKSVKSAKTTLESNSQKPLEALMERRKPPMNSLTSVPQSNSGDPKIDDGQKALQTRREPPANSLTTAPKSKSVRTDKVDNGQQTLRARRKPPADSQITAPLLKHGSKGNTQQAQTSQQVPSTRSRKKAGGEEPVVLRRSKRSSRK